MRFAWNAEKAAENLKNRGVSLEEAVTVFYDPLAATFGDRTILSERAGF